MSNGPTVAVLDISDAVATFIYSTKHLSLVSTEALPALHCAFSMIAPDEELELSIQEFSYSLANSFDESPYSSDTNHLYNEGVLQAELFVNSIKALISEIIVKLAEYGLYTGKGKFPYQFSDYSDGQAVLLMNNVPAKPTQLPAISKLVDFTIGRAIEAQATRCNSAVHYWL